MDKETNNGVPVLTIDVSEDFTSDEKMNSLFTKVKDFCDSVDN